MRSKIKLGMTRLNLTDLGFEWIQTLNKQLESYDLFTEVSLANDEDEADVVVAVLTTERCDKKLEMRWRIHGKDVTRVVEYTHAASRRVYYKFAALQGWQEEVKRLDKEMLMQADLAFYLTPEGHVAPIKYRLLDDLMPFVNRIDEVNELPKDKNARELAIQGREWHNETLDERIP